MSWRTRTPFVIRNLRAAGGGLPRGVSHFEIFAVEDYLVDLVPVGTASDLHLVFAGLCENHLQ